MKTEKPGSTQKADTFSSPFHMRMENCMVTDNHQTSQCTRVDRVDCKHLVDKVWVDKSRNEILKTPKKKKSFGIRSAKENHCSIPPG